MAIPKIIHYFYDDTNIWEKNTLVQVRMCVNSWLKYCSDYKIMLWHDNMPEFKEILKKSNFVKEAYKLKLWAFIADYIRHYALYKYGGIYLDTDVQLVNNFDKFLDNRFFCSIELDVLEHENVPEPAVMGAEAKHPLSKKILSIYESDDIFNIENFIANVITKKAMKELYNFQYINYSTEDYKNSAISIYKTAPNRYQPNNYELYLNQRIWQDRNQEISIYPNEYFCPSWSIYQRKAFTKNTVAIHWNQSSWWDSKKLSKLRSCAIKNPIQRFFYIHRKDYQVLFSLKNSNDKLYKIITILGIRIYYKRRKNAKSKCNNTCL